MSHGILNCLAQQKQTPYISVVICTIGLHFSKTDQMGKLSSRESNQSPPLDLCALTMVDDSCSAQCWVEVPIGPSVLANDGATVAKR